MSFTVLESPDQGKSGKVREPYVGMIPDGRNNDENGFFSWVINVQFFFNDTEDSKIVKHFPASAT